jgi:hypothetical protein
MKTKNVVGTVWCRSITLLLVALMSVVFTRYGYAGPVVDGVGVTVQQGKVGHGGSGSGEPEEMALWVGVLVLVGIGVATYYGMKQLTKAAGLTNAPPPVVKPPVPPNTNYHHILPSKAKSSVVTASASSSSYGASGTNTVFQTLGEVGIATFDASGLNELYGETGFTDPAGSPYLTCSRAIIQSAGSPSGQWSNELTVYTWKNANYICVASYTGPNGDVLKESVLVSNDQVAVQVVALGSLDEVMKPDQSVAAKFFRLWSGVPAAP